jgi:hypothetical protein
LRSSIEAPSDLEAELGAKKMKVGGERGATHAADVVITYNVDDLHYRFSCLVADLSV